MTPSQSRRTKRAKSGDFVRVPIDETRWGYGRVTADKTVAIYDIISDSHLTPEDLQPLAVLFRAHVMNYALNGKEWPVIGNLPLEEKFQSPAEFLSNCTRYERKKFYGTNHGSNHYPISYEHAKTLELLAIYDPIHVAQRLALHAEGKPDPMQIRW